MRKLKYSSAREERPKYRARFRHQAVGRMLAAARARKPKNRRIRVKEPRVFAKDEVVGRPIALMRR
jgi:hypothetical protein